MKFTTIVASALALFAVAQAEPLAWSDCAGGPADFENVSFVMATDQACVGQKVCGTLTGNLINPIAEGSTFSIEVKYLGRITRYYERDFCSLMAENGITCPIAPGPKTINACISDWNADQIGIPTDVTMSVRNGNLYPSFCQRTSGAMNVQCDA
ncbi:hypothetical protein BGX29_010955 [Mortierella sp. GBA35]|nr:hypothetical protein BGX29_010955 [Mortierella sp. GBA35]KAF9097630.1 hypothetical protein BGX23_008356 [Mortierella sp. AD031]KAG0212809.1 hypothetical protein BGX33_003367 [Mortierella sp. NVP41]